ncbi:MAG: UDP-N-acetylmuramoyl-L-alanyl-D-glutamate--2,6-diaminopimelate ligase [Hydrogenophilaceae bacterium]|nr:UDP-N-acetylmuramoyl-L-alanyl-D-glutamate--2,6-diaminopimelate ligase [Hydrogenophilaceae bacterium]
MSQTQTQALIQEMRALQPPVRRFTADSRKVHAGDAFLAYAGGAHDGRRHIADAIEAGARAVLWEPEGFAWQAEWTVFNRPVASLKAQAAAIAAEWYGHPSEALWTIGVTGTNGKTSCSHWLAEALTALGRRTAMVGTLGNGFPPCGDKPGALSETGHTTPDAVTLQGLFAEFREAGAAGVAMEVSSHALDQGRVEATGFDVAVLTNLSRDHLDYHGDMAAYAHAKAKLFDWPGLKWAVLNLEDELGQRLYGDLEGGPTRVLGYGLRNGEVHAEHLELHRKGMTLDVTTPWGRGRLQTALLGEFNAYNLLACLAALLASEVKLEDALAALAKVKPVAGRLQRVGSDDAAPTVIVDYAHTPDALHKVLDTLKPLAADGRLICVFGCGGGRDKGKRPQMGGIASAQADRVIVTSDNPRGEDPAAIIAEILAGMPPGQTAVVDRADAIARAIAEAGSDDIVLIAGKGHEDYQEIAGRRLHFSDVEEAARGLAKWRAEHAAA